ncbi:MAG: hypothetical protein CL910_11625 [Deltaproteobacteria bacterium]|nr:hypothetical protein [Deltaproteobacteria bacterium]
MQLLGPHRPRDTARLEPPSELPGDGPRGAQKAFGVESRQLSLIGPIGHVLAQESVEPCLLSPIEARRTSNRSGNQQIALDVAPPPRERFEAVALLHARRGGIAVQYAQPTRTGVILAERVEMRARPLRATSPEDDQDTPERTRERRREPPGPAAEDLPIARALYVDGERCARAVGLPGRPGRGGAGHGPSVERAFPSEINLPPRCGHCHQGFERFTLGAIRGRGPLIGAVIADDHAVVREGLRRLLEAEGDIEVFSEASDGREVLEEVAKHQPEVVILDISMPKLGGLETLERLRSAHPAVKVILLSVHGDRPYIQSAVNLGADGYVLKNGRVGEVVSAVRAVTRGGSYFSPPVAKKIVEQLRTPERGSSEPFSILSSREREVLQLIAEGLSAKEIASELGISTKTVEAHRTSVMRKLGARKATALVRYALRHGLIEP